jgi:hypothetical protein
MPIFALQLAALNKKQKSAEALLAGKLDELQVRSNKLSLSAAMTHFTVSCRGSVHAGAAAEQKTRPERESNGGASQVGGARNSRE